MIPILGVTQNPLRTRDIRPENEFSVRSGPDIGFFFTPGTGLAGYPLSGLLQIPDITLIDIQHKDILFLRIPIFAANKYGFLTTS